MVEWLNALKDAMTAEKNAYLELLDLSEKERDILIANDINALNAVVRREAECLRAIRPLAKEREALSKKIG